MNAVHNFKLILFFVYLLNFIIDTIYGFYTCLAFVCVRHERPQQERMKIKIKTEHFVYGKSKELMNILSLTL